MTSGCGSADRRARDIVEPPPLGGALAPGLAAMELLGRAVLAHVSASEPGGLCPAGSIARGAGNPLGGPSPRGAVAPVRLVRDDGYVDEQPAALFVDESLGPHEAALLDRCRGDVLDGGCGGGRLALPLQRRGLRVVGLDISPTLVEICRRRGLREARVGSVWDDPGGPWDTVLLGGNNIGLGVTLDGAGRLLRHLAGALRPGGAVAVASVDVTRNTDPIHLDYHERNRAAGRPPGMVRMCLCFGAARSDWFDWLHLAPAELRAVATAVGLRVELLDEHQSGAYAAAVTPA